MPNTMYSFDNNSSNVPAFLVKLWKLVEDPTCDDLIAWSDSGYSFVIKDQSRFAKELLPQYFKHNNMASFIRQLNMYGFKKVMNIEKSGLRNENDEMEFQNSFFIKEKAELLELIKRKIPNTRVVTESPAKTCAKDILYDLTSVREKQENMDNMILKMKKENELLWRELTSMRQKHKAQEQIIQKVIQFLVSIVQRSNQNIGVQRKITRMIHNSPASKTNSAQVSRTIDVLRKNNPDCIIVPEGNSPLGPVIHEVIDGDHEDTQNSTFQLPLSLTNQKECSYKENQSPVVASPISPTTPPVEPLSMLEALEPRTSKVDEGDSDLAESILGIPWDCITVSKSNDGTNMISIPENSTICNVIPISDSDGKISVIPIPGGSSNVCNAYSIVGGGNSVLNTAISSPTDSIINNVNSVPGNNTIKNSTSNPKENISTTEILSPDPNDISSMDYFDDIDALGHLQPSTSFSVTKEDFDDQLLASVSLNTPKMTISDEDPCGGTPKVTKEKSKQTKKRGSGLPSPKTVAHNEQNYQLSTTDSSSLVKNFSNHLLSVDEKLASAQDLLLSNPFTDVQNLLGVCGIQNCWTTSLDPQLFSSDEVLNYESFANQLSNDINIKSEPDIVGNELVQFTPNMLETDMDIGNTQLFEALNNDSEVPSSGQTNDFLFQSETLLPEVLNDTAASEAVNEISASEAASFLNDAILSNNNGSAKRRKQSKTQKTKRRKVK